MKTAKLIVGIVMLAGVGCDLDDRSLGATPGETGDGSETGGEDEDSLVEGDGKPPGCDQDDAYEPNGSKSTATLHPWGGQLVGELCGTDIDVFRVEFGTAVGWLEPSVSQISAPVRTRLYAGDGPTLLGEMTHGSGQDDFYAQVTEANTFYVTVQLADPNSGPTAYQLEVDRGFPDQAYVCDESSDGAECGFDWNGESFAGHCAESGDETIGGTHPVCVVE